MSQEIEALVLKHFPFEKFNPGQKEAIVKAVRAFRSGKKHVIIEAPTGIGKSVIATTVHRVLKELDSLWRTTIVAPSKGLQDQYIASDSEIYDLRGKTNYHCINPLQVGPYNSPGCRQAVHSRACDKKQCPYVVRREIWGLEAPLRLTNASFQIEACPPLLMGDRKANLVVMDECHGLPQHLVDHSTLKLIPSDFFYTKRVVGEQFLGRIIDMIDSYMNIDEGTAFVPNEEQRTQASKIQGECEAIMGRFTTDTGALVTDDHSAESVGGMLEELQTISDKLSLYAKPMGEWILTEYKRNQKVELKPVYAHQVAEHGFFRKGDCFLHMSATICGFAEYRKSLGISDSYVEIAVDNPIPVDNRPVKLLSAVQVSGNYDRTVVARVIDKIIDRHGQENGVIHTVSFKLAEEIVANSKHEKRLVISNDRAEIMKLLGRHNSGAVILSPSITTGYDFKGDLARWQVIAKVPFLFLGDSFVKLNMERSQNWYNREALLKMIQACGRVVRGVDDYGVTYIIDKNAERLIQRSHDLAPDWWLESLIS